VHQTGDTNLEGTVLLTPNEFEVSSEAPPALLGGSIVVCMMPAAASVCKGATSGALSGNGFTHVSSSFF
jgi:hypothetical protein